jgi:NADH pyrophosphatase NudC (nudix superfamily)
MYYIYHIKGIKIGCSKEPNRRVKNQGYTEFEILEQYEDIEIASKREIELQQQYGYKKDNIKYSQTISSPTIEGIKKGGYNSGNKERMRDIQKKYAHLGGLKQGAIQGNINKENGHMSRLGKKMTEYNNRVQICPYCGKESRGVGYIRWHGDKCKKKPTD